MHNGVPNVRPRAAECADATPYNTRHASTLDPQVTCLEASRRASRRVLFKKCKAKSNGGRLGGRPPWRLEASRHAGPLGGPRNVSLGEGLVQKNARQNWRPPWRRAATRAPSEDPGPLRGPRSFSMHTTCGKVHVRCIDVTVAVEGRTFPRAHCQRCCCSLTSNAAVAASA